MNIEEIREFCLSLGDVEECFPFDQTTLVFKIQGKMFALIDVEEAHSINLKCNPEAAIELREHFDYVLPGYHMNKKHWNTVLLKTGIADPQLKTWIKDSFELVAKVKK